VAVDHVRPNPTVLITGGAGFIGSHLANAWRAAGSGLRLVDDLRVAPLLPLNRSLLRKSVLEMTKADLAGVDVVYHLASDKNVPRSFDQPLQYLENLESTTHLLRLCTEMGVARVIVASTCEVYGRARNLPTGEDEPLAPLSPYAASKVAMEMVVRAYQEAGGPGLLPTVVRFFNVYGPGERPDAVIPRFCAGALTDGVLPIEGAGTQRRDFSYIDDVVDRLVRLVPIDSVPVINLGSGVSTSISEIARIVSAVRHGVVAVHRDSRRNEIGEFTADITLQQMLLARSAPVVRLEEGIARTLEWWSESEERLASAIDDGVGAVR
jgi:dTDP-glucose 4,6-dehydratase/UDP-glucose 4-epimerase